MKQAAVALFVTLVVAASTLVILNRLRPPMEARSADAQIAVRLSALEGQIRKLAEGSSPAPFRPDSRPAGESGDGEKLKGMTVNQRLDSIEIALFDFERTARREIRLTYEETRKRIDQLEAHLLALLAKPLSPEQEKDEIAALAKKGVKLDLAAGRFEVEAVAARPTRQLEFLGVAEGGRAHESLLLLNVTPSAMKRAAEKLGLKPGRAADFQAGKPPEGDGLYTYVAWEGRPKPIRIEKLVLNTKTGNTVKAGPLVFIGSRTFYHQTTFEPIFAADVYNDVIALTWNFSGDCVFGASDEHGHDEYIWAPNPDLAPAPGTPTTLTFCKAPVPDWDA
ncbi:MAG TPA: YdjY domain-containing protein [Planctomycetota bacterium]|nr:YdjY domain-containing protein [Planctomycetota bacterium]